MGDLYISRCKMCCQSLCLKHAMICECGIYYASTDLLAIGKGGYTMYILYACDVIDGLAMSDEK
jgi:hypothetical protein